jgi:hypothetical protein
MKHFKSEPVKVSLTSGLIAEWMRQGWYDEHGDWIRISGVYIADGEITLEMSRQQSVVEK